MKALILAAGFGSRLRPFTDHIPKPLFPVNGRPVLDLMIQKLIRAGCCAIMINTHHLHRKIDAFIGTQRYSVPVVTRYEPDILGTGGAVKNISDFWDLQPLMVINSDIITDIDLKAVYDFHLHHPHPVTMVMHDYPEFNTVAIDQNDFITGFDDQTPSAPRLPGNRLSAFTGIQVLDPAVLDAIPDKGFSSIIDAYRNLICRGNKVKAFIAHHPYWRDIGTPVRYRQAAIDHMAPEAFNRSGPAQSADDPPAVCHTVLSRWDITPLSGDGSDRNWYRIRHDNRSLIIADHGIGVKNSPSEIGAYISIGRHLLEKQVRVPEIFLHDMFSGLVFVEDLGDINLQAVVRQTRNMQTVISIYHEVIDQLILMSVHAADGFDPSWAWQTAEYDRGVILENECRYFIEAFVNGYLGLNIRVEDVWNEFENLADNTLKFSVPGFMHRDMQSRNIMVTQQGQNYFIDFQGGRIGPIQYDIASLLNDPYVTLPGSVRHRLFDYYLRSLNSQIPVCRDNFRKGYHYCCITRNLQILAAFGFLSRIKKKIHFEQYIPTAALTLAEHLSTDQIPEFPRLKTLAEQIKQTIQRGTH